MDDRFTGYDIDSIVRARLDAAKLLVRINLADSGTARTLEETARAVSAAASAEVPIMLEPFMSSWVDGRIVNDLSPEAVISSVAIASGLGNSSAYSWLKLPVVRDMERVMESATLPTLLLGGDADGDPDETFASWQSALTLPGVRGLIVGRTLLYPPGGDVIQAVDTAATLVHG
jgi:DhnA family fructose-bisphosphate aldolase class Ia